VNTVNKRQVQQRFDKASQSYASVADVQRECAHILVGHMREFWPDVAPHRALDLGCGTGEVAELLLSHFPRAQLTLNDLSMRMLECAKTRFSHVEQLVFQRGDFEHAAFDFHDLIISNMALQWAHDLPAMLHRLQALCNRLVFSCLIAPTFASWAGECLAQGVSSPVHLYPQRFQLEQVLMSLNAKRQMSHVREFKLSFANPKAFMHYLRSLGASVGSRALGYPAVKKLLKSSTSPLEVSYHVFFSCIEGG